jgi:hypothetical protein
MAGKVYFYNLFNEVATLSLNGGQAGTINGWDKANGYAPSSLAVDSATHDDEATGKAYRGGNGQNAVEVHWDSGFAKGTVTMPTVNDNISIDQDLVCYIAKNDSFVEDTQGFVHGGDQALTFTGPD